MDRRTFLKTTTTAAAGPLFHVLPLEAMPALRHEGAERFVPDNSGTSEDQRIFAIDKSLLLPHIGLAGTWSIRLDPKSEGQTQRWFEHPYDAQHMFLPGSTDQAGYGSKTEGLASGHLSRPYIYTGPAWYQTNLTIPELWRGDHATLFLERCHWQTSVWVDGKSFGTQNSLSTPQVYDLGIDLEPGRHRLTICVDNTIKINVGASANSITEQTQTNWNGIIGKIELRSTPPVWIENVRIFPDISARQARLEILLDNRTGVPVQGKIEAALPETGISSQIDFSSFTGQKTVALTLPMSNPIHLWDEYQPSIYTVDLRMTATADGQDFEHAYTMSFGMREIGTKNTQFSLNGRPIFLRGTVDNAEFPLTAYPAMELDPWRRIFRTARSYGMNHLRFHSWCPPEAAFIAADEAGFLLHVELPVFSHHVDTTPGLKEFMRQEGHRILRTYGNHPSFTMLCMGNELKGDYNFLDELVAEFKQADDRHLYTYSTNNGRENPGPTSEYWVTEETLKGRLRIDKTRFGATGSGTDYDFSKAVAGMKVPVVAHELGQWVVYPSYAEIGKYIGVLKPRNLEVFREQLAARGMIDQAGIFQIASGRFSAQIYKEDIESALRTPHFGGFQLLQLNDYPGQQEALVGMLDSFWDSKGLISPVEYRRFCSETVPLLRFGKFVWTSDELFHGTAELAHYGKERLHRLPVIWSAKNDHGHLVASGKLSPVSASPGSLISLGEIRFPLSAMHHAQHLTITLRIENIDAFNTWNIWVYPHTLTIQQPEKVLVTNKLDTIALDTLQRGGTVFLYLPGQEKNDHLMKLRFLPVFWSFAMFRKQPGVVGVLCDPQHPALAHFPTEMHSNWQWWELTEGTRAFVLDDTPACFRPLIQVIDDFHRNHKLGLVFEARVGEGKLLVTSLDLGGNLENKPVSRQLLYSLLNYASSETFHPQNTLTIGTIRKLVPSV